MTEKQFIDPAELIEEEHASNAEIGKYLAGIIKERMQ